MVPRRHLYIEVMLAHLYNTDNMKILLFLICFILINFAIKSSKADEEFNIIETTKLTYITNFDGNVLTNYEVVFVKNPIIIFTNNF